MIPKWGNNFISHSVKASDYSGVADSLSATFDVSVNGVKNIFLIRIVAFTLIFTTYLSNTVVYGKFILNLTQYHSCATSWPVESH